MKTSGHLGSLRGGLGLLPLLLTACMGNAPVLGTDETQRAIEITEPQARIDLACPAAKAGRTLRSEHLTNATEPLHSLYRVWVEGCGRHGVYEVLCDEEDECRLENR